MINDYRFKTEPYEHQLKAFELCRDQENFALLMEQGCVDAATEFLSPTGWIKISQYSDQKVAQWNSKTNIASFVTPSEYVKLPCEKMLHFKTIYGLDQMLSPEHRMPIIDYKKELRVILAEDVAKDFWEHKKDWRKRSFPVSFILDNKNVGVELTEFELRLQIAVIADSSFPRHSPNTKRCVFNLKKDRKVKRLQQLVNELKLKNVKVRTLDTGYTTIALDAPLRKKEFDAYFWRCSTEQLKIIVDEVFHWDGSINNKGQKRFFTRSEKSANFICYALAALGYPTRMKKMGVDYTVSYRLNKKVLSLGSKKNNIRLVDSTDGFKYCFEVPTSFLVFRRNGCVFVSGNTGKTKVAIDKACYQYCNGVINAVLIVAPNGVHTNWISNELNKHIPEYVKWIAITWSKRVTFDSNFSTALAQKDRLVFFAINIDALSTDAGKKYIRKFLDYKKVLFILDESSRIKTPAAQRTKAAINFGKFAKERLILTGTPITQSPFDLYAQFKFLDPFIIGFQTYTAFKNEYGIFERKVNSQTGYGYDKLVEYKNLNNLKRSIEPFSFRVTKEECLDLPEKIYQRYQVELTSYQRTHYNNLKDELLTEIQGKEFYAPIVLTQLLRLQQITGGFLTNKIEETIVTFDDNPKMNILLELIEDCEKVIIWARFVEEIKLIVKKLKQIHGNESTVEYWGEIKTGDRLEAVTKFQTDDNCRFFVGNPRAAGIGLTLTAAKTMIYFSNDFSLETRLQSEDRAHRIGQIDHVTYIDLEATETVDAKIIDALRSKKNIADLITGDNIKSWL